MLWHEVPENTRLQVIDALRAQAASHRYTAQKIAHAEFDASHPFVLAHEALVDAYRAAIEALGKAGGP